MPKKNYASGGGTLIGEFDLLIGSSALANGLVMVTKNTREFSRLSGLEFENWVLR